MISTKRGKLRAQIAIVRELRQNENYFRHSTETAVFLVIKILRKLEKSEELDLEKNNFCGRKVKETPGNLQIICYAETLRVL